MVGITPRLRYSQKVKGASMVWGVKCAHSAAFHSHNTHLFHINPHFVEKGHYRPYVKCNGIIGIPAKTQILAFIYPTK